MESRSLLDRIFGAKTVTVTVDAPVEPSPAASAPTSRLPSRNALDLIGQQSEHVRERVTHLSMRLDELKSLSEDFGQIVRPMSEFLVQHGQAKTKLLEVEAVLQRERELNTETRAEFVELQTSSTRQSADLASALSELLARTAQMQEQETVATELRLRVDNLAGQIETLERQLGLEADRSRTFSDDNQKLRYEIDNLEKLLSRAEAEVGDMRERHSQAEGESARLQQLTQSLTQRNATLSAQIAEFEPLVHASREEITALESRLANERMLRQKSEANRDVERSGFENEILSLKARIDGLVAQIASSDKMMSNLKEQLRERSEVLRATEKLNRDIATERIAADRRAELATEASLKAATHLNDAQRTQAALQARVDMLTKAVAAKDGTIESSARKIESLESHVNQLIARHEKVRGDLENANRRLIEELQDEKAERSLAQGALDIARDSRAKVLAQLAALKRQQAREGLAEEAAEEDAKQSWAESNVRPFRPPEAAN